jgi:tetratricopeptide (TPR) repeat protein
MMRRYARPVVWLGLFGLIGLVCGAGVVWAQAGDKAGTANPPAAAPPPGTAPAKSDSLHGAPPGPSLEEKQKALEEACKKNPKDVQAAFDLGNLYYDQGNREEAEKTFRKVLELKPDHVRALVNLGVVLNEGGKSQDGLAQLEKALAVKPNDSEVLAVKGQILYALKRYNEAVDLYKQAIQINSKSQKGHYWLGVAFADAGIYREAIKEWKIVVDIDPDSPDAGTAREGIDVLQQMLKDNK